jgi:hypothetical protein
MEGTEEPPTAKRTDEAERGTGWIGALVGMPATLGAALLLSGLIGGIVALAVARFSGLAPTPVFRASPGFWPRCFWPTL